MKALNSLNVYFLKYKWLLLAGIVFVSLSTIFGTYQAVIVRKGTNAVLNLIAKREQDTFAFVQYGLTIIGLALISGLFMFLMRQTIIVMSRHIEYDQKNEVYSHYQALDAAFFKDHTTGDLMNRITEDVGKVRMYTGPAVMYLANTVVTVVTVLLFMTSVNWKLTVFVFLPLPFLSFMIYKVSDLINKRSTKVQEELSALTSHAQETFSAIRVIKAYTQEKFFRDTLEERGENYKSLNLKLARTEAYFQPTMMLTVGLSILVTVWYGGYLTVKGEIEPGNITEFILYVFRLTWPFASLGWVTSLVQRAAASQERINEFMRTAPKIRNTNPGKESVNGDIEFKNVSFTYPESGIVALQDISFHLKKGQTLGITGPVGSGKSTIAQLIGRFYDADSGEILIGSTPIARHDLFKLRRSTGVVPQEVFLFSDTISGNIAFSGGTTSPEKIGQAAKDAAVHDNIMSFPLKYETMVGERGITLSGGQKQRVSIARAILNHPDMLIFDDCLSAVDTETETTILANLKRIMKGKTSIIISQRVSSIRHADLILYMNNGRITEMGTHEELLRKKGDYFSLHELQKN